VFAAIKRALSSSAHPRFRQQQCVFAAPKRALNRCYELVLRQPCWDRWVRTEHQNAFKSRMHSCQIMHAQLSNQACTAVKSCMHSCQIMHARLGKDSICSRDRAMLQQRKVLTKIRFKLKQRQSDAAAEKSCTHLHPNSTSCAAHACHNKLPHSVCTSQHSHSVCTAQHSHAHTTQPLSMYNTTQPLTHNTSTQYAQRNTATRYVQHNTATHSPVAPDASSDPS